MELQSFQQASAEEIDDKEQQLAHIQSDLGNFIDGNANLEAQLGELIAQLDTENSLIEKILSDQRKKRKGKEDAKKYFAYTDFGFVYFHE